MRKILFLFLTFLLTTNLGFCAMKNDNTLMPTVDEIIQAIKDANFSKPAVEKPCPPEPAVQKTDRRIEAVEPGVKNPDAKD